MVKDEERVIGPDRTPVRSLSKKCPGLCQGPLRLDECPARKEYGRKIWGRKIKTEREK
jgi:hypothetical protein